MIQPFPYMLLRSPLQSLREAWHMSAESSTIFREGLYLSSPEFWKEFQKREQLNGKEKEKLDLSYAKYWLRSCARCTPYGTFAGSAMIDITEEPSRLELQQGNLHRRSLRLDMNYLAEIVQALVQIPEIRDCIKLFPNNSIYPSPGGYRFAEYSTADNTRIYHLAFIADTPYIAAMLARASGGATWNELSETLMNSENVTAEEASGFITELWQSQLLIAELEPTVTGEEPLSQLITRLENTRALPGLLDKLKEIQRLLNHPAEGVNFYLQVEEKLNNLGLQVTVPKNTLQADMFLALQEAHISKDLVAAIVRQAGELKALSRQAKKPDLEDFKTKFKARYEDAEIPLSLALDIDLGIGYAAVQDELAGGGEFVDGLPMAINKGQNNVSPFDYIQQFTLAKYNEWALHNKDDSLHEQNNRTPGKNGIEIQEEELKTFEKNVENFKLPCSMHLMGSLLKQDGLLDATHFTFDMAGLGGPSGANLLGRFTHGDNKLSQYVKDILQAEEQEQPEAIFAEIAHLPQARIGNILLRPVLRSYEIPYVGLSGADRDNQITLDDLVVSVRNNAVLLYSRRHNRRVIPRLTTAHNFSVKSLPVYKFLCDLQGQGLAYPNVWDWGHLTSMKHLPRVTYKNLIIHKALWKIEERDLPDIPSVKEELPTYMQTFRNKFKIPEKVFYKEGDNELLIDFTQSMGICLFLHYLKRYKNIQLEEFLFTEDNCVVHDTEGAPYTNEIIIPVHQQSRIEDKSEARIKTGNEVQRAFLPYSEWLYFKIYCGAKAAEHLLSATIQPFIDTGIECHLFERFFFIRYRDESGGHFRIRFFNTDKDRQLVVYKKFMQILQPHMDNGTIDKVMLDTYKRELERYTPQLIDHSENIFHNDSLAVLRFIHLLDGIDGEHYRLLFAMRGIDTLLTDFGLDAELKSDLLKELQTGFFKEFGGHPSLQKQLNERYRKHQRFIASHMDGNNDVENEIDEAAEVFSVRSEMNIPVIRKILSKLETSGDTGKINSLLSSYIHMFMNRLFIAQQRKYELVVYHFLEKYYASRMAITKKEKKDALPAI